jgi:Terminase small subunit
MATAGRGGQGPSRGKGSAETRGIAHVANVAYKKGDEIPIRKVGEIMPGKNLDTYPPLTPRRQRFVAEYLCDLNASQAAIRAGYSRKTAGSQGERLLKDVEVCQVINERMKERSERTGVTADKVIIELARVAFSDIGDAFDNNGDLKQPNEMSEDISRAIARMEMIDRFVGRLTPG